MSKNQVILITGTRKGIGRQLAKYYQSMGSKVIGCSRQPTDYRAKNYRHFCIDVTHESQVVEMFAQIRNLFGRLDVLINNAGIASMNHLLLTPHKVAQDILNTNFTATFLCCREAAKLMKKNNFGRIVNFTTVAVPLKLEGEAIYASSKAAVITFTQVAARELASYGITVNAIGPTPIKTDLIRSVPQEKIEALIQHQAIRRFCECEDITNVIDFLIKPESDFVTGQVIFLGGI